MDAKRKCILINLKASRYNMKTAPQALAKLGGIFLKRGCWEVKYLDEQITPLMDLVVIVQNLKPDLIGISSQAGTVDSLWNVLNKLDDIATKIPVFVGNITATYGYNNILKRYPNIFCSLGRGEKTFWKVAEAIETNRFKESINNIPNIAYISKNFEEIIINEQVFTCEEEIDFYSDWNGLFGDNPVENYEEFWIEFSHGCPRKANRVGCVYCAIMPDGGIRQWHPRDIKYVIKDYFALASKGIKHIKFSDEEFLANSPQRIIEFAKAIQDINDRMLLEKGLHPTFDFSARVDDIIRLNKLDGNKCLSILKEAGLLQIYLGLESGNDNQLKRMQKGVITSDNYEAVRILKRLNIRIAGGWIMFDPFMENPEEILLNSEFLKKAELIPHSVKDDFVTNTIGRMRVLEGAPLVDMLNETGFLGKLEDNLIEYNFEYINPIIRDIVKKIEEWEAMTDKEMMYRVKSIISLLGDDCSVNLSDNDQASLMQVFFEIKSMDLEVCEDLAKQAIRSKNSSGEQSCLFLKEDLIYKRKKAYEKIKNILKSTINYDEEEGNE